MCSTMTTTNATAPLSATINAESIALSPTFAHGCGPSVSRMIACIAVTVSASTAASAATAASQDSGLVMSCDGKA